MAEPKALRLFLDGVSDAVLVLDRSACVHFANRAALGLFDCPVGTPVKALAPLLGAALVGGMAQTALRGIARAGTPRSPLPDHIELPDGRRFDVAFTPFDGERWALRLAAASGPSTLAAAPPPSRAGGTGELIGLFWGSPFPVVVQDRHFCITDVNQAYVEFTGRPPSALIGTDPVDLQPEEDREANRAFRDKSVAAGDERLIERRLVDAGGRVRWFRSARRAIADEAGQTRYVSVLQDSTAEHAARDQADRTVRELDDWFDVSPAAMVLFDALGLVVRANPAFEVLAGQAPVMLSEASPALQQLLAWRDGAPVPALQAGAGTVESFAWLEQPGGGRLRLRSLVRCYVSTGGQPRYMAVVEDRSVEEERDLAQVQIGALVDTAGVALATFEESSGWVQHGSAGGGGSADGVAATAALQSIRRDVVLPESMPEYERLQLALRHAQRAEVRYAIRHAELGQRWLLTRVEPARLASGKQTLSVVTLDITDQHQSQQRNELLLREMSTILESAPVGIAYLRGDVLVRCNRRFETLLGLGAGEALGNGLQQLLAAHPDAARHTADIARTLAGGEAFEAEVAVALRGRPGQWCALTVRRVGGPDAAAEVIAVLSDVTRLKAQQLELESLVRDRELMFSVSDVGIAFVRADRIQRANEALSRLTGHEPSELGLVPVADLFANVAEFTRIRTLSESGLRTAGRWSGEHTLRRRDGSLVWVQVSQRLVVDGDAAGGVIASYVNVDDRHRAQQAVGLQAERTRAILDSVLVGIVTVGPGGIEWMNRSARRMFGGDLADFVGQAISTVATPEADHPFRRTQYLNDLIEGQAETFECRVRGRDGREFWVVGNAVATGRDATGRQLTYALLDIERRRQAEARTAQAQSSLQRIIGTAPLAITLFDAQTLRVLEVNEVAARSAERVPHEMIGRLPEEIHPAQLAREHRADMQQALVSLNVTQRERRVVTHGETRLWDARYLPLASPGQPPDQLLLVATDVTEQRAAQEARFEAAIAQREMLVKEVHHRIKNNLQGVAGLLQQIGARKPEMAEAMAEVGGQVQAIAQVYGLQVGVAGPLRLRSVLEAITGSVQRTFGRRIDFESEGAPVADWGLPEAESIPIALTLNELLTNAIKHSAAAGAADSTVGCRLSASDGGVHIVIDNEGRLPEGFSLARYPGGVSGLGLIRALLPRRSASLTVEVAGGRVVATVSIVPPGVTRLATP